MSFSTRDELGDKIDKLTVAMSRLAAKDIMRKGPLNPKYIRVEVRIGPLTGRTSRIGQVIGIEDRTK